MCQSKLIVNQPSHNTSKRETTNHSMDHIAQIEGVQDIILRKLPLRSLTGMALVSKDWLKPSLSHAHNLLQQKTDEFIQRIGVSNHRMGYASREPLQGHGWAFNRAHFLDKWHDELEQEHGLWWRLGASRVDERLTDLLRSNGHSGSDKIKQKHTLFRKLCEKHSIYRPSHNNGEEQWSNSLYYEGDKLLRERLNIEIEREELVEFFRIRLPKKSRHINAFAKATRPDLIVSRLEHLTKLLQKT